LELKAMEMFTTRRDLKAERLSAVNGFAEKGFW
jgi:hypothetical protein